MTNERRGGGQNQPDETRPWAGYLRDRRVLALAAFSAACLPAAVPYFWAGDLHSHIYNAWLSLLIERGALPGLSIADIWTNRLLDEPIAQLLRVLSPRKVEAVVLVALAQLFLWSAFLFVRALSGKPSWEWLPILVMLALGGAFHTGTVNWYASASLSLLATATILGRTALPARVVAGIVLLLVASAGNPLPPAWACGAVGLAIAGRRGFAPRRILGAACAVVTLIGVSIALAGRGDYFLFQLVAMSGADQLMYFDNAFVLFAVAYLGLLASSLRCWARDHVGPAAANPAFAIAVFSSVCVIGLPDRILFPGYIVPAFYLSTRASLICGIAWVACAAQADSARRAAAIITVAAAWLALTCAEWEALSSLQQRIAFAVAKVPRGARVVSTMIGPSHSALYEAVNLACVGHCFVWSNYEAATRAFRVRAEDGNAFVISRLEDLVAVRQGEYRVPALPFALWKIGACPEPSIAGAICATQANNGEVLRLECLDPRPRLGHRSGVVRCDG